MTHKSTSIRLRSAVSANAPRLHALIAANVCLRQASLSPFFFAPEHAKEFSTTVAQALTIETQPLVNAIYNTVKREMQTLASR